MQDTAITRRDFFEKLLISAGAVGMCATGALSAEALLTPEEALAYSVKKQKGWCLGQSKFTSVVNNKKLYVAAPSSYGYGGGGTNTIAAKKGNCRFNLKTTSKLANGNAQSMAFANGYVYVLYTRYEDAIEGRIAKYRFSDVKKGNAHALKWGPYFTTGHGQTLAYNPVTDELWVVQDTVMGEAGKGKLITAVRIGEKTLKPNAGISFRLKDTVSMGHNLAFDAEGNAYFYTYSAGINGNGKTGNVKFYKGIISTKEVKFDLIEQGLRWAPGEHSQSLGYDPSSNRLVLVADASISSVPVAKLGNLKPADVKATVFNTRREFEGMEFDAAGNAYLLSNRPVEILKSTKKPY